MPKIHYDPAYPKRHKHFVKGVPKLKQKVAKCILLFETNPQHPSLHLEKLSDTEIWTIRIDRGNRLFFIRNDKGDAAIFFNVGKHDLYRNF